VLQKVTKVSELSNKDDRRTVWEHTTPRPANCDHGCQMLFIA